MGNHLACAATPADAWAAKPHQQAWQWRTQAGRPGRLPWPEAFAFREVMIPAESPASPTSARWLSLQPADAGRLPAFHDALHNRLVMLAASARVLCSGAIVDRLLDVSPLQAGGLPVHVSFSQRMADGTVRRSAGYGDLDAQGHWSLEPADCDFPASAVPPRRRGAAPAGLYEDNPRPAPQRSSVVVVSTASAVGLRDRHSGRWLTPPPSRSAVATQWAAIRRVDPRNDPSNTGDGIIDAKGRMVVPFIFGELRDALRHGTVRLCPSQADRLACQNLALPQTPAGSPALRSAKDEAGKWGYLDTQGRWAIAPRFDQAQPFVAGYAVVHGTLPQGWASAHSREPMVVGVRHAGRVWVVTATANAQVFQGLMDDQGRWLIPVPGDAAE